MISVALTNNMLQRILAIEACRTSFRGERIPPQISSRLRKNSRKRSAHSSTKIEGNPLTAEQADRAIEDEHRHFLKPEEEVRNYYRALQMLDERRKEGAPFDRALLLEIQSIVVAGSGKEKIGLRGPMPPGVLFAVYDSATGVPEYIPPEASEIDSLLNELFGYLRSSDDHPLIKAAVVHYQLVTTHPFEDGNGRTARLLSGEYLEREGFGFGGLGSLEEYFAYDVDEYYGSLQMGLPPLFYNGREDPPHPEIWFEYFLRMVELYAQRASSIATQAQEERRETSLSHVSKKAREFYEYLEREGVDEFAPIEVARVFGVTNRTVINWSAALAEVGLLAPVITGERIRRYKRVALADE